jgi:hypothetical protein
VFKSNALPAPLLAVAGLLALVAAGPALAGSNVLPSSAKPKGYSLVDAARATAVFNTGPHDATPPKLPLYTLTNDATLKPGTFLYVPVFYADDSGQVVPPFPTDVTDQQADADYLMGLVKHDYDVDAFIIVVDGKVTVLDDSYVTGTKTPPLQDGPPAGTNYIVSGAFVSPLSPGVHTVGVGGLIDGEPVVFLEYTVTVTR